MQYIFVGRVTRVFTRINVAAIVLEDDLYLEDWILIEGPHTELEQQVLSMQINRENIEHGQSGDEVAIKLEGHVHEGDEVFVIAENEPGE